MGSHDRREGEKTILPLTYMKTWNFCSAWLNVGWKVVKIKLIKVREGSAKIKFVLFKNLNIVLDLKCSLMLWAEK